jgi:gliding motility-associated-like protein
VVPIAPSGTASVIADVSGVPATVTIPDGSPSVSFPIGFPGDGALEGSETLTLCVSIPGACGGADSACASVTIIDDPPIVIVADDFVSDCSGAGITLSASASGGNGILLFSWSNGSDQSSIVVPDAPASYQVTATDACGNQASAVVSVIAPCAIIVPNVFSPNNDGNNDTFEITGIEFLTNHVRIYNRWGQVVFEAANYGNTWNGGDLSDGTYFYEVSVQGYERPFTGHLTILDNRH